MNRVLISSANIACGFHAGTAFTMEQTIKEAVRHQVAIGAHPGYPDKPGFGRQDMSLNSRELYYSLTVQIRSLRNLCFEHQTTLRHVKPHGALYNRAAQDQQVARIVADAVKSVSPEIVLIGLAGSFLLSEAEDRGLRVASEVFADRRYTAFGQLVPRTQDGAIIHDSIDSLKQVEQMVFKQSVKSIDGKVVKVLAQTICLHGDHENSIVFAKELRTFLELKGCRIAPLTDSIDG